jgi:RimJ/RimL family protein N-acetyltransferase
VLVAADGQELVGFLVLGPWVTLESAAHVTEVRGLAVAPVRQGEGIGARLLVAAIERCRREGVRRLVLRVLSTNPGARRLYERHGFEIEGAHREAFLLEGAYVDDLLMALDLSR